MRFPTFRSIPLVLTILTAMVGGGCMGHGGEGGGHEEPGGYRTLTVKYVNGFHEAVHMDAGATIVPEDANRVAAYGDRSEGVGFAFPADGSAGTFRFAVAHGEGLVATGTLSMTKDQGARTTRIDVTWNGETVAAERRE